MRRSIEVWAEADSLSHTQAQEVAIEVEQFLRSRLLALPFANELDLDSGSEVSGTA